MGPLGGAVLNMRVGHEHAWHGMAGTSSARGHQAQLISDTGEPGTSRLVVPIFVFVLLCLLLFLFVFVLVLVFVLVRTARTRSMRSLR